MTNDISQPAFPSKETRVHGYTEYQHNHSGLSKREYFAGLAMQNLQNVLLRKSGQQQLQEACAKHCTDTYEVIAKEAVLFADALLRELEK